MNNEREFPQERKLCSLKVGPVKEQTRLEKKSPNKSESWSTELAKEQARLRNSSSTTGRRQ
jgi:hypothetical protein